ncbi:MULTISPECIES: cytochrome P450 [unclassified Novosphingobium]|uniref:cytochrome P450 n=1 Tax=unclassified Novosphingobium TaxID=2644732 RepID=UPI000D3005AA|nr:MULTISPECIES: cytochrome P450 [unclassified Novosphingobium]PTR12585.1 cytochrome P450 [Novosphingobium sp. GV055]PUB06369.1 cytochrome P450 [Novosphingobium sp. GV061]PUB22420.1 cytochrome P450 [Novosphingobium sp. GV079]PUB44445.1 cytochrome P450 [Novosphingobium sp. GV027]
MTAETLQGNWVVPENIDPKLVVDWDIYTQPELLEDIHLGWHSLHGRAPDIFWTPRNGGHWVVLRFDDQSLILKDAEHFSSNELHIPPMHNNYKMIPLNLDPPEHTRYRAVLMRYFGPAAINAMEPKLRVWANRLIDRVIDKGECDFTEALGAAFPVSVFMELMGMDLGRFEEFRSIVTEYFAHIPTERRAQLQEQIFTINRALLDEKRRNPGEDVASALVRESVRGEPLTQEELESIGYVLFLGGLDTVANALTFAFRFLATRPDLQDRLAREPERLPDFVEESLRRFAVVNQTRVVKHEVGIKGAHFMPGQMLICPLTAGGLDPLRNPDPESFDLDRKDRGHITFSIGAHTCIGNVLARMEMRVFTNVWLERIGHFQLGVEGKTPWRAGMVMGLEHLPLTWKVPAHA